MEESLAFDAWIHVMYSLGLRKLYRPNMIALQVISSNVCKSVLVNSLPEDKF